MNAPLYLLALCSNFLSVQARSTRQQHVPRRFCGLIEVLLGPSVVHGTLSAALHLRNRQCRMTPYVIAQLQDFIRRGPSPSAQAVYNGHQVRETGVG
jgi:hypothetical protein